MKTIDFVIPVYNEEERLTKTMRALKKGFSIRGLQLRYVIFVDDGSTDNTVAILRKNAAELRRRLKAEVHIFMCPKNRGKGYAVRQGMLSSSSDYTLCFDADMSTPITELNKFLPYIKENAPVIIGTRKDQHALITIQQPKFRQYLGRTFTMITQILFNVGVSDFTCGFKVFSRAAREAVFPECVVEGWGADAEVMFLAARSKFMIVEQPVLWADDNRTHVQLPQAIPSTLADLTHIHAEHTFKPLGIFVLDRLPLAFYRRVTTKLSSIVFSYFA